MAPGLMYNGLTVFAQANGTFAPDSPIIAVFGVINFVVAIADRAAIVPDGNPANNLQTSPATASILPPTGSAVVLEIATSRCCAFMVRAG